MRYNNQPIYIELPSENATLKDLQEFITTWTDKRNFFDRSCGYVSWAQGKALNRAREVCPRGKWAKFLQTLKMSRSTAYHLMRIAKDIPEENARGMTYTEMLGNVYPSFREDSQKHDNDDAPSTSKGRRSNGGEKSVTVLACLNALTSIKSRLQRLGDSELDDTGIVMDEHREKVGQALSIAKTASAEFDKLIDRLDAKFAELNGRIAGQHGKSKNPKRKAA